MTLREYHAALAKLADQVGWETAVVFETTDIDADELEGETCFMESEGPEINSDERRADSTVVVLR